MAGPWYYGCRSTRDGGFWHFYRDSSGSAATMSELRRLIDRPEESETRIRRNEITDLLRRATQGGCAWWSESSAADCDVRTIERQPKLLELRWEHHPFDDEVEPVLTRLYFSEPGEVERMLLALRVADKDVQAADHHAQQNDDIDVAEWRRVNGREWWWGYDSAPRLA